MSSDYSKYDIFPNVPMKRSLSPLEILGWSNFFAGQIDLEALSHTPPCRVVEVHRSGLHVVGEGHDEMIPPLAEATVGDWVLLDPVRKVAVTVLERRSVVKRPAPGTDRRLQLIAANIDTAFIVSSCNQDFNVARLERYLALVFEAEISPVILLTKSDLTEDVERYLEEARAISDLVPVIALDALQGQVADKLSEWCKPGKTVAFLGSSGVGKSTLTNALIGRETVETQGIREDDAKGRHTTTSRQLHVVEGGPLVLDTPGMRELQLSDVSSGIEDVFADLHGLSQSCHFKDCGHESEPGCAVLEALEAGEIDEARVKRWRKLLAEEAFNSASFLERRRKDKAFGKKVRKVMKDKASRKGG